MSYLTLEDINKLPIIFIGEQVSNNGHIDFIDESQLKYNACQGEDKYGRIFVVIKVKEIETDKCYIQTFFKRYRWKKDNSWMGTTVKSKKSKFINTNDGMSFEQQEMVKNLLKGKIITLTRELQPVNDNMIGNLICLW